MNEMTSTSAKAMTPRSRNATPTTPMTWLRTEIDRLFDDFGGPARNLFEFGPRAFSFPLTPALEFTDEANEYRLTAELPGLTDKDIKIDLTDGLLSISGEKKEREERKENGFLLNERRYGSFDRQIALPNDIDPERIKAKFDNGVLTITLGKDEKAQARSRKIEIE